MDFSTLEQVPEFLALEDWGDRIGELSKAQLTLIAEHKGMTIPEGVKKGSLLLKIVEVIGLDKKDESFIETQKESELLAQQAAIRKSELEVLGIQLQLEREKATEREKEREEKEKERKHELEVIRLKQTLGESNFNVNTALKLVPSFEEKSVPEFFVAFEKLANRLKWPREMWTTLIQNKLIGKAQKVYATLSEDISVDYVTVKEMILRAYELVPEAYRQKFREFRKLPNQTYVEFARVKKQTFLEWMRSKEVDDFDKLQELMLVEEFKSCIPREMKVHLEELKLDTLQEVAIAADEYILSHKSFGSASNKNYKWDSWRSSPGKGRNGSGAMSSSSTGSNPSTGKSEPAKKEGKIFSVGAGKVIKCYFCSQVGHTRNRCEKYRKFSEMAKKPVMLVGSPKAGDLEIPIGYMKHSSEGEVSSSFGRPMKKVKLLRDTGAVQSLILRSALPNDFKERHQEYVVINGFPNTLTSSPRETLYLNSEWSNGLEKLAVVDSIPVGGIDVIIGNDIADREEPELPIISPEAQGGVSVEVTSEMAESPVCVVTRSSVRPLDLEEVNLDFCEDKESSDCSIPCDREMERVPWNRSALSEAQKVEFEKEEVVDEEPKELTKPRIMWHSDVLYRFSRSKGAPALGVEVRKQIVVPSKYREKLISLAHDNHLAGHFGMHKTMKRLGEHFFWPNIKGDVKRYVQTCDTCQKVGKPNQKIPKAPLIPIPIVKEPFQEVVIDIVGPLPRTRSGHEYLLTIIDRMSHYPEAIPVRSIRSPRIVEELIGFFTKFGMPKVIQSDCGSNFVSKYFQEKMTELGIKHVTSSPYHPESQGIVERFHQTLKSMLKKFCLENETEWDKEIPYVLFAFRSVPGEAVNYSPFQLIFGHSVRGPLDVVREHWEGENPDLDLLTYMNELGGKLTKAWDFARENLTKYQGIMKGNFDKKATLRKFDVGDEVLVLLPSPGHPLKASFSGPWVIEKKVSDVNYWVFTPDRRRKHQLCHVNMLKPYLRREKSKPVPNMITHIQEEVECKESMEFPHPNSHILNDLPNYLSHLDDSQKQTIGSLVIEYKDLFKDTPGHTTLLQHDVDIGEADPIKQGPYRLNPVKNDIVDKEVQYMLDNDLIEPSGSPWSSPVVLVKKEDGQFRLCFDYRKLNSVTKTDSYPLPRVDDCIDKIGGARYISKFDLLKGYWQVGLTPRARAVSAFVTSKGLFECKVMPFGMKNAAATFQRLMNTVTKDLEGCVVYIDDLIVYSDDWETHVRRIRKLFKALRKAGLVVNLKKSEFGKARVMYLGHEIGFGQVTPKDVNIKAILDFPIPHDRKAVRKFLGMAGYYRRFVRNFSDTATPLTNLLCKNQKFEWSEACQDSFNKLKTILTTFPVLRSPDFTKPFILSVDASDTGVGATLSQGDSRETMHPVGYFSKKLSLTQSRYSTIEKEALSLILALNKFEVYLGGAMSPIKVFTDHNPLQFINKFKNKNQRLLRWSLILQEWDLDIKHIPGRDNIVPDVLSRV